MVRAKFKVESKTERAGGGGNVELNPVTGGSAENEEFWKYTPAGSINMYIDNVNALEKFEVGKEYYVDFTEAGGDE
ncbi:hypothetical protein HNQ94_000389 [Salirhabdus euzebyi]|uniref:Uncharacterized protein n=1 Tax=Salirhabdus euzebyi TaxID=394506 RepID=A0A841Q2Y9_9BACI|nr:hypothetical protein [Salirhabdus euzebyi]MBB6451968.1 hypothetical protein [Salirhabdus euzebyi]